LANRRGLPHDLEIGLGAQNGDHSGPVHRIIVRESEAHAAHRLGLLDGRSRVYPPLGLGLGDGLALGSFGHCHYVIWYTRVALAARSHPSRLRVTRDDPGVLPTMVMLVRNLRRTYLRFQEHEGARNAASIAFFVLFS